MSLLTQRARRTQEFFTGLIFVPSCPCVFPVTTVTAASPLRKCTWQRWRASRPFAPRWSPPRASDGRGRRAGGGSRTTRKSSGPSRERIQRQRPVAGRSPLDRRVSPVRPGAGQEHGRPSCCGRSTTEYPTSKRVKEVPDQLARADHGVGQGLKIPSVYAAPADQGPPRRPDRRSPRSRHPTRGARATRSASRSSSITK